MPLCVDKLLIRIQDAQAAPGSDDDSQRSEEQQAEDIAGGVAQVQEHGWEEEVVWQEMQAAQDAAGASSGSRG